MFSFWFHSARLDVFGEFYTTYYKALCHSAPLRLFTAYLSYCTCIFQSRLLPVITLGRFTKIWFHSHPKSCTTTIVQVRVDILWNVFPCCYPINPLCPAAHFSNFILRTTPKLFHSIDIGGPDMLSRTPSASHQLIDTGILFARKYHQGLLSVEGFILTVRYFRSIFSALRFSCIA